MKNLLIKTLDLLRGRKTSIATILGLLITFSLGREWLAVDTANLISAILVALGLSANYATAKIFK